MWSGPIQNEPFIAKMLEHVDVSGTDAETGASYGTAARIRGMLNVAKEVRASFTGFRVVHAG